MAEVPVETVPEIRRTALSIRLMPYVDRFGVLGLVFVLGFVSYLLEPEVFLTWGNISNIFRQIAFNSLLALGEFIVIVTAGIDLSVGSVLALSMMTTAVLARNGYAWPLLIL